MAQQRRGDDAVSSMTRAMRTAQPYLDASWQLIGSVALCTLGGWWLDGKLGTAPWLLIVGSMLGLATGMWTFMRVVLRLQETEKKAREERGKDGGAK